MKYLSENVSLDTLRLKVNYQKSFAGNKYFKVVSRKELDFGYEKKVSHKIWSNNDYLAGMRHKGEYIPKFWIENFYRNPHYKFFCLEFSVPKLLKGTNLLAVNEQDLKKVIFKINQFCKSIGIELPCSPECMVVTKMACSKNANISNLCSVDALLICLHSIAYRACSNMELVLATAPKKPRQLTLRTGTISLCIYSKMHEMANNSITNLEKEITEKWVSKDDNVPQEVVRFEVTLKKKLAVRQKMQRLGYIKKEYTLSDVFKESVWTGILTGEIAKVFNCQIPKFTYFAQCSSEKINKVIDVYSDTLKTIEQLYYFLYLLQTKGYAKTREYITEKYSASTWKKRFKAIQKMQTRIELWPEQVLDNIHLVNYVKRFFQLNTED